MGFGTNLFLGILIIAIGIDKLTGIISGFVPVIGFIASFILLVLGYFVIRSGRIITTAGGGRRVWLQWFIGVLLILFSILDILVNLGASIPYTEVLFSNWGGIVVIILGALTILMGRRNINL